MVFLGQSLRGMPLQVIVHVFLLVYRTDANLGAKEGEKKDAPASSKSLPRMSEP